MTATAICSGNALAAVERHAQELDCQILFSEAIGRNDASALDKAARVRSDVLVLEVLEKEFENMDDGVYHLVIKALRRYRLRAGKTRVVVLSLCPEVTRQILPALASMDVYDVCVTLESLRAALEKPLSEADIRRVAATLAEGAGEGAPPAQEAPQKQDAPHTQEALYAQEAPPVYAFQTAPKAVEPGTAIAEPEPSPPASKTVFERALSLYAALARRVGIKCAAANEAVCDKALGATEAPLAVEGGGGGAPYEATPYGAASYGAASYGAASYGAASYGAAPNEGIPPEAPAAAIIGTPIVAVCSPSRGLGCTHLALLLARYLQRRGYSVALDELNDTGAMEDLAIYEEKAIRGNRYELNGVSIYKKESVGALLAFGYDYIVLDIGSLRNADAAPAPLLDEVNRATLRIMVSSAAKWHIAPLSRLVATEENAESHWLYVFNNIPERRRREVRDLMEGYRYLFLKNMDVDDMDPDAICEILRPVLVENVPRGFRGVFKRSGRKEH